jgi:hypothetical protein
MITVNRNGVCSVCHARLLRTKAKARAKAKHNLVHRSSSEKHARRLCGFSPMPLQAPPTAMDTSFLEDDVTDAQWSGIVAFALQQRHTTDTHGARGTFRVIHPNKNNLRVVATTARALGLFGTPRTRETGAQRFLRLYAFITLRSKWKVIEAAYGDVHGVHWETVRRTCGAR